MLWHEAATEDVNDFKCEMKFKSFEQLTILTLGDRTSEPAEVVDANMYPGAHEFHRHWRISTLYFPGAWPLDTETLYGKLVVRGFEEDVA